VNEGRGVGRRRRGEGRREEGGDNNIRKEEVRMAELLSFIFYFVSSLKRSEENTRGRYLERLQRKVEGSVARCPLPLFEA
jgi:hypothetical protein